MSIFVGGQSVPTELKKNNDQKFILNSFSIKVAKTKNKIIFVHQKYGRQSKGRNKSNPDIHPCGKNRHLTYREKTSLCIRAPVRVRRRRFAYSVGTTDSRTCMERKKKENNPTILSQQSVS
jgi:hypothetical protein